MLLHNILAHYLVIVPQLIWIRLQTPHQDRHLFPPTVGERQGSSVSPLGQER